MTPTDGPSGTETILVVDDDADARRAMCRTLDFHGYRTLEADGGETALRALREGGDDVDLVLLDIVMPGMSGLTLARKIHEDHAHAHVLLTSGYADRGVPEEEPSGERTHFLKKPMTIQELAGTVREILDGGAAGPDDP